MLWSDSRIGIGIGIGARCSSSASGGTHTELVHTPRTDSDCETSGSAAVGGAEATPSTNNSGMSSVIEAEMGLEVMPPPSFGDRVSDTPMH